MRHGQPRKRSRVVSSSVFAHPLIRLILFLLILATARVAIATFEFRVLGIDKPGSSSWYNTLCILAFVGVYIAAVRVIENRPVTELGRTQAWLEAAVGATIGALLFVVIIVIIATAGAFGVTGIRFPDGLWSIVTLWMFVAISEEIGLRAVIFRFIESWAGSWIALAISAFIFGATHLGNKDVSWAGVAGIAVGSGILYAAIFMITRRLWAVAGVHFAWNLTEGTVFGTPVSGFKANSMLVSHFNGPAWLTGGAFGPEASVPALMVLVVAGTFALMLAVKRKLLVRPSWQIYNPPEYVR